VTNTVGNVIQGLPVTTGGVLIGTSGASLPTSASAATTGFTALGYVGDAGLTESRTRTTDKIKAWGGDVVKVVQSEFSVTYQFTLYESLNANVLKAINGSANVATSAATSAHGTLQSISVNGGTLPKLPWIFDMKDGDVKNRIVVPLGQVTAVGDIVYSDAGVIGYPVTLEAFADGSGNQAYVYTDDGATV
jgi:hypothetical protein